MAFRSVAGSQFVDLDAAVRLADLTQITVGDDGEVTGAVELSPR